MPKQIVNPLNKISSKIIGNVELVKFECGCKYGHNFKTIVEGNTCGNHVPTDLVEHFKK